MNKYRRQFVILFTLLIISLLFASTVWAAPKDGPVVSLSTAQSEYGAAEDVVVTVTILNPTRHSVRVLKWFTPAEGVEEPIFEVRFNGLPVPYTGAIYKRPAPTGNDYITLKSGESMVNSVNLGDYYDLAATGQYEIYYDVNAYDLYFVKGKSSQTADTLNSEPIFLKIDGRAGKGKPTPPPPQPGGTSFNACSTEQQNTLNTARANATTYASGSESYLNSIKSDSLRYEEWFGTFDSYRHGIVTTHFTSLADKWANAGVTFDCKCKQNYYAYVYPDRPYVIYLCRVFWYAPAMGTDSQAGTLIHEMSHFYTVSSTIDYVYGQSGARALADSDPAKAIMNADNHEYFAENTPFLP